MSDGIKIPQLRMIAFGFDEDDRPSKHTLKKVAATSAAAFAAPDTETFDLLKESAEDSFKRAYEQHRSSVAGQQHHREDRIDFQKTYRLERNANPTASRQSIVTKLKKRETVKEDTLLGWAKKADDNDSFCRKPGRPKKSR